MPTISVVVPVYCVEAYLNRCVDSILRQTYHDFELVLVDDGSPDSCPAICDEYAKKDNRVHVIHQENRGLSAARNAGIDWTFANSDSEWITFIDSDDWVHPRFLQLLHEAATELKVNISYCHFQRVVAMEPFNEIITYSIREIDTTDAYLTSNGCGVDAYAWGRLYKRMLFNDIRYPVGKIYEDIFTTPHVLFKCSTMAELDLNLYYYFYSSDSLSHSMWKPKKMDMISAYEENLKFFSNGILGDKYRNIVLGYYTAIHTQYTEMCNSNISHADKQKYAQVLKHKMKKALNKYAKHWDFTLKKYGWLYAVPYPHLMHIYWRIQKFLPSFGD